MKLDKINKGNIWHNYTWKTIFEYLPTKEHNQYKSWWIEKVFKTSDSLLADKIFSHYQLKCEEGFKNKIPAEFNDYIEKTFNTNERYITNLIGV